VKERETKRERERKYANSEKNDHTMLAYNFKCVRGLLFGLKLS
jgi:hypothetical protein